MAVSLSLFSSCTVIVCIPSYQSQAAIASAMRWSGVVCQRPGWWARHVIGCCSLLIWCSVWLRSLIKSHSSEWENRLSITTGLPLAKAKWDGGKGRDGERGNHLDERQFGRQWGQKGQKWPCFMLKNAHIDVQLFLNSVSSEEPLQFYLEINRNNLWILIILMVYVTICMKKIEYCR